MCIFLFSCLQHAKSSMLETNSTTSAASVAAVSSSSQNKDNNNNINVQEYCKEILCLGTRTIHSAWDDNDALLVPWIQESSSSSADFHNAVQLLQSIVTSSSSSMPVMAQLHSTGCLVTEST